jgi:lysozyme
MSKGKIFGGLTTAAVLALCIATTGPEEGQTNKAVIPIPGDPWTICKGHTAGVHEGDVKTNPECEALFSEDMLGEIEFLQTVIKVPVTLPVIASQADQSFNTGHYAYAHSTMLKKLNAGDVKGACEQFRRWTKEKVPAGDSRDIRDGVKDGWADCSIRANGCYGIYQRRERMRKLCLHD